MNVEHRTLNVQHRIMNPVNLGFFKSIKRSVINIQSSMLDVRCSTFNPFTIPVGRYLIRKYHNRIKLVSGINPQFFQLAVNRPPAHTQQQSSLGFVAAGLLEGLADGLGLVLRA